MNESPVQPDQTPAAPQQLTPEKPHKLALWSLILGIAALVLALIVFISVPAAIIAIIFGILTLVKHRPGKGLALAGIITGGAALIFIPIVVALAVVSYNGISEKANEIKNTAIQKEAEKNALADEVNSNATSVDTDCYSYDIPKGYEYDEDSKECATAVNLPGGDALSRIVTKGNTGKIGTLQDVVATLNASLKKSDPNTTGIIDQEQFVSNGNTVYFVSYKDANGLLFGNYIIPDSSASQTVGGQTITAYTVAGYVYNSSLKGLVRDVVDSLNIK
jgi:hypothetical protein